MVDLNYFMVNQGRLLFFRSGGVEVFQFLFDLLTNLADLPRQSDCNFLSLCKTNGSFSLIDGGETVKGTLHLKTMLSHILKM